MSKTMEMGSVKVPDSHIERTGYIELQEPCNVPGHEKYNLWHFNDEIICPRCESERRSKKFSTQATKKQFESTKEGRKLFLKNNSILHDRSLLNKGIKDYINKNDAESDIKKHTHTVVKEVLKNNRNVFMVGPPGVGKTHLMMGMLKNINELGDSKKCLFVSMPKLLSEMKESFNKKYTDQKTSADYLNLLVEADVLGLDDIGSELSMNSNKQASNFTVDTLYNILNARENKTTIFTSNLSLDELSLILDARTVSRIKSNLLLMDFNGITDKREYEYTLKK